MKKILYIFIAATILISCESDNDTNLDPIIGTWELTSTLIDQRETYNLDECNSKSSITYFEDETLLNDLYQRDIFGDCIHTESKFHWTNLGNSQYNLGGGIIEVEFSNNNKTYKTMTEVIDPYTNKRAKLIMTFSKN